MKQPAKRILFLFGSLEMGGAERQGLLLARYLQEQKGAAVKVWGLGAARGAVADQCERWGIPWRAVPLHWGLRRRLPHLIRLFWCLRMERPDILLSYTTVPNLAAALLWRRCGIRLCIWNQADAGLLLPPSLLHRQAISRVPHLIANAEGGRQYLLETFGLDPSRVCLIRNGVSLAPPVDDRRRWRERLGAADDTPVAVMVANLSRYKDHATLLQAWQHLLTRCTPAQLPILALAGRFDDQADTLHQQAAQLGIDRQVRFLGTVADISGLLAAADLCVHSSPSEGLPNAVLEAMASGLAVVGSDIPGMREAVGCEGTAFLAPPGQPGPLADQLERLLGNQALRSGQGALMQRRAHEQFGLERMCRETVAFLEQWLGESV